jgi:hypothetical protein
MKIPLKNSVFSIYREEIIRCLLSTLFRDVDVLWIESHCETLLNNQKKILTIMSIGSLELI